MGMGDGVEGGGGLKYGDKQRKRRRITRSKDEKKEAVFWTRSQVSCVSHLSPFDVPNCLIDSPCSPRLLMPPPSHFTPLSLSPLPLSPFLNGLFFPLCAGDEGSRCGCQASLQEGPLS